MFQNSWCWSKVSIAILYIVCTYMPSDVSLIQEMLTSSVVIDIDILQGIWKLMKFHHSIQNQNQLNIQIKNFKHFMRLLHCVISMFLLSMANLCFYFLPFLERKVEGVKLVVGRACSIQHSVSYSFRFLASIPCTGAGRETYSRSLFIHKH